MKEAKAAAEREVLLSAMSKAPKMTTSGAPNLTKVAQSLGWSRMTVWTKAKEHGLWPWREKKGKA